MLTLQPLNQCRNGDLLLLALGLAMLTSIREEVPAALSGYVPRLLSILTGPRMEKSTIKRAGLPVETGGSDSTMSAWQSSPSKDFGFHITPSSLNRRKPKTQ
jgi:hypothetical protein